MSEVLAQIHVSYLQRNAPAYRRNESLAYGEIHKDGSSKKKSKKKEIQDKLKRMHKMNFVSVKCLLNVQT